MSISVMTRFVMLAYPLLSFLKIFGPSQGLPHSLVLNVMAYVPVESSDLVLSLETGFMLPRSSAMLCFNMPAV